MRKINDLNQLTETESNNNLIDNVSNVLSSYQLGKTYDNKISSTSKLSENTIHNNLINKNEDFKDLSKFEESEHINKVNITNNYLNKQSGGTCENIKSKNNNVFHMTTNFEDTSDTQGVFNDLQQGVNKLYTYLSKNLVK